MIPTMRRSVSTSLWIMFLIAFMSFSSIFSTTTITATSMSSMSQFDLVDHVLKESMPSLTNLDFQTLGRSPPTDLHTVVFMPKQLHQQELFQILYEVSDPLHKKYGNYWTKESIVDFTQDSSSIAFIKAFLAFHQISITKETLHSEYIYAQASIATWEKMFQTEFQVFSISANTNSGGSTGESRVVHRCYEYSLPKVLHDHVMAVFNTVHMPVMKRLDKHLYKSVDEVLPDSATSATPSLRDGSRSLTVDSQFPGYVTPSVIQSTYQVDIKAGNNLVSQGLYESLNQTMSPDDLSIFQQVFNLLLQPISGDTGHVSNSACYASLDDCIEANLDVQYIMGVGQGIPTYYDYDDSPDDDFLLNWITMIANSPNPHTVYSISYGAYEESMTKSYIDAFDMEVAKLGLMGTSVFASSGDDGVAGFYAKGNDSYCSFAPQYPASSPYVTAVGGTNGPQVNQPEVVCQAGPTVTSVGITSGGGFSNYYNAPPYQKDYINSYFNQIQGTGLAPIPGYNRTGRGYPDISLMAHNYFTVLNASQAGVDGTSASSPVMAALVNLVNAQRKASGLPTLGFLNPLLYSKSMYFANDITSGSNFCTALYYDETIDNYQVTCCSEGFYATSGWDPATGLGSLNFAKFNSAVGVTVITDSTDDDDAISGGGIAGIIIGTLFGLILIGAIYYYFRFGLQGMKFGSSTPMHTRDNESFDNGNL